MAKSPDAFRTISEVADWLGIQAHVLRFWESKFSQVKPIKRAGGRRYYRPTDMLLLGGIKKLLHDDGLTIKGVQKILREEGMSHVADLSQPLDDTTLSQLDDMPKDVEVSVPKPQPEPEPEQGVVLNFEREEPPEPSVTEPVAEDPVPMDDAATRESDEPATPAPVDAMMDEAPAAAAEELPEAVDPEPAPLEADEEEDTPPGTPPTVEEIIPDPVSQEAPRAPMFSHSRAAAEEPAPEPETASTETPAEEEAGEASGSLPAFLRKPLTETPPEPEAAAPEANAVEPAPPPPTPKPRVIDLPDFTAEADFDAAPSALSAAYRVKRLDGARARQIAPLLDRLTTLRDDMNAQRRSNVTPSS